MNCTSTEILTLLKSIAAGAAGVIWAFTAPIVPYAELCTFVVFLDYFSARQLGRRLRRKMSDGGERDAVAAASFSSARFGRVISTLVRVYLALVLAAAIQNLVVEGMAGIPTGFNCVKFVTGVVCFRQLMSVLENESTCSDAAWARRARRYLIDKSARYLGLDDND